MRPSATESSHQEGEQTVDSFSGASLTAPGSMADPTNGAEAEEELVDYEEEEAEAVTDVRVSRDCNIADCTWDTRTRAERITFFHHRPRVASR